MTEAQIERLINKAKKGNKRAFERLLRQKENNIAYIALGILRNEHDAEDAVQDAVLAMYRSIQDLQDSKSFNSWMYKTVYRSCLHVQDKRKKGSGVELDDDNGGSLVEERTELIPETSQELHERREYLMEKLDLLPDNYRTAMYLFYFEDMPYLEIAKVMDCSKKNVSNWLERGKAKLRSELEKDGIVGKKELQTMLSVSTLGAVFATDLEKTLTPDQKLMVANALEVALGAAGTGVVSSVASTIAGTAGALLASKILPTALGGLAVLSALSIGTFVLNNQEESQTPINPEPEISQKDDDSNKSNADVKDKDKEVDTKKDNKEDKPVIEDADKKDEEELDNTDIVPPHVPEVSVGDPTITEGRDEDGIHFIIENEVYYEIMDEYDEEKLNSKDDPESVSNTVIAIVDERPWSPFVKTGDIFLSVGVALGAISLLGFSAMIIARRKLKSKKS